MTRRGLYRFLHGAGAVRLSRRIHGGRLLILAYHGIAERTGRTYPWTFIPLGSFERQIEYVSRRYRVIPLADAVDCYHRGLPLPRRAAVITFDDGYRNNALALPVLARYGTPATVFVTAGYLGSAELLPLDEAFLTIMEAGGVDQYELPEIGVRGLRLDSEFGRRTGFVAVAEALKGLPAAQRRAVLIKMKGDLARGARRSEERAGEFAILSVAELRAMLASGLVDVGAHTMSHEILTTLDESAARWQVGDSKSVLERVLNRKVDLFAYPNGRRGDYDGRHVAMLRDCGYRGAVTTAPSLNAASADVYQLGRISVGPELAGDLHHFAVKTSGLSRWGKSLLRSAGVPH